MSLSLRHGHYVAERNLPDDMLRLLGKLNVEWSFLEWRLQQVLWCLFRLHPKGGRIITSQMNNRPRLQIIVLAVQLFCSQLIVEAKAIMSAIESDLQGRRNDYIHGLWASDPNTPGLFIATTTGNIQNRLRPQVEPVTAQDVEKLISDVAAMSARLEAFRAAIEALR